MKQTLRTYGVQLALVGVAAVWGGTFVTVKDAVARYPMYAFLTLRFAIAVLAFVAVVPSALKLMRLDTLKTGVLAGLFLTAGYVFQTWGLQDTSASKAAFITGMFVVITPVLQAFVLRRIPHRTTVVGVILAVIGLWFLSGGSADSWNIGDTRVLICAFAYAGHFIVLGAAGEKHDVRPLTLVQLATVGAASAAISLATEPRGLPGDAGIWFALVLTGVFASAVAFAVQTYAQRTLSPTKTALILIMEPVFGGVFGYFAGERLGVSGVVGSALIFLGMLVAEVLGLMRGPGEPHVELEQTIEGPPILVEVDDGH